MSPLAIKITHYFCLRTCAESYKLYLYATEGIPLMIQFFSSTRNISNTYIIRWAWIMNNAMLPQRTQVTFTLKWTELLDIFSNQVSLNRYMLGDCGYSGLPWLLRTTLITHFSATWNHNNQVDIMKNTQWPELLLKTKTPLVFQNEKPLLTSVPGYPAEFTGWFYAAWSSQSKTECKRDPEPKVMIQSLMKSKWKTSN